MNNSRVLTIDDESEIGELISDTAVALGFDGRYVCDFRAFRDICASFDPTIIFIDLQMPDVDGIEILNELHRLGNRADIVLISGYNARVLKSARDLGISKGLRVLDILTKPIDIADLESCLNASAPVETEIFDAQDIAEGIAQKQFFPRFQPKLSLAAPVDTIIGAEALIRWRHPVHGEVPPVRFIALAEKAGLIGELTEYMLSAVTAQMRAWQERGFEIEIAVNLSAMTLNDLGLPDRYAKIVREGGIEPSKIILEVTESAVMTNVIDAVEILTRFRLKGFGLSIDDFGTGYSSLVQLYRMPFNELKIDRAFVGKAPGDREAAKIVKIILNLARELEMSVCAEGVETMETLEFLRSIGCEKAQGYLMGKPLLASEFAERCAAGCGEVVSDGVDAPRWHRGRLNRAGLPGDILV
ncbi:MAG: EAL domain-containing response regulator [Alphaproteobacteria bacterium]